MVEYKCVNCNKLFPKNYSYCPNCGSEIEYLKKTISRRNKILLILSPLPIIFALIYIISPIDFDFIPIFGWLDDLFVGVISVKASLSAMFKGLPKNIISNPLLKKISLNKNGPYPNMFVDKKGYPRFKDSGKLVHRAVSKNKVGGKIFEGYDVHHIDGNKMNFRKSNLRLIEHSKHSKLHWLNRKKK